MKEVKKYIIKNGLVVIPDKNFIGERDILIEGDIISCIGEDLYSEDAQIIDAKIRYVVPGIIDMHAHL